MTEQEYNTLDLESLLKKTKNPRKQRLFAVAVIRNIQHMMVDEDCIEAIDAAERYADKLISEEEYYTVRNKYWNATYSQTSIENSLRSAAFCSLNRHNYALYAAQWHNIITQSIKFQYPTAVFRDIFFYKHINIPKTPLIVSLAKTMYESNDFSDIPILHDILLDSNANNHVLDHLKQPIHVRGCWIIDNILNK